MCLQNKAKEVEPRSNDKVAKSLRAVNWGFLLSEAKLARVYQWSWSDWDGDNGAEAAASLGILALEILCSTGFKPIQTHFWEPSRHSRQLQLLAAQFPSCSCSSPVCQLTKVFQSREVSWCRREGETGLGTGAPTRSADFCQRYQPRWHCFQMKNRKREV